MADAPKSITWKDIGIVTGIHSAIALVCFIIFTVLRSRHYTRKYYAPKLYDKQQKTKPARLPTSYFGWIWPVLTYNEEGNSDGPGIVDISGLDLAVYLRVIKLGINLSLCLAFFCLPILVPLHITSHGLGSAVKENDNYNKKVLAYEKVFNESKINPNVKFTLDMCEMRGKTKRGNITQEDIDQTFMTNVRKYTRKEPNHRLWAHLILCYVVIFIIIFWLQKFNLDITNLRVKFLATVPRGGPSHTALITDVPGVKAGTVIHTINKAMNSTVLRVAPKSVQSRVNSLLEDTADAAAKGVGAFGSKAVSLLDEHDLEQRDAKMSAAQEALQEALADPWKSAADYMDRNGNDFKGLITHEMETIFNGKVVAVNPVYNQEELQPVFAKYEKVKGQLTDLVDDYMGKIKQFRDADQIKKRETSVLGPMYGAWGMERYGKTKRVKVDALDFLCEYFDECKRQVKEAEEPAFNDPTCSAFVTFKDRVSQTTASTSLICQSEMAWRGQAAPGPEEVVWTNLSMRFWEKNLRNLAMWALFITIVLFFTIVCAFLQGLINGPLTETKQMQQVLGLPVLGALIQGILPTLVLKIFLAILPMILAMMQRFAGAVSDSEVDFGVVTKFYWFQFSTVFLSAVIGGALLEQAKQIINSPDNVSSIVENLFNTVPTKASFFINFILLQGLAARSIGLLRAVGLILFFVFSKLAATERARTRLWADQKTAMGTAVADHTIVMLLMIVFSVAAPVILAFGFLYFVVTSITERYQMIYVYRLPYESGGKMWKAVFAQVMVAAYTFLITMAFLLGAKGFPFTPLIIPAFFFLVLFHAQTLKMFTRPWVVMSLRSAALLDNVEQTAGFDMTEDDLEKIRQTYLSPVFKVTDAEHQAVLDEASVVKQFFAKEIQYQDIHFDDDDVPDTSL